MTLIFEDPKVEQVFRAFPRHLQPGLYRLRELIFCVASRTDHVGRLEETLKWGQPAYLTPETKSGSTLRLGTSKHGGFAIYVHCQTTILSEFRTIFPNEFIYEGNRAIHFQSSDDLIEAPLKTLIRRALTYHIR